MGPPVAEEWPGSIAHEYQRLRQLLEGGDVVCAIFQLKDVAEVLIKFPALVLARDLIEHGPREAAMAVRRGLLGGRLSMGGWLAQVRDTIAPLALRQPTSDQLMFAGLARLFVEPATPTKTRPTDWLKFLEELVEWRNQELGHGAFRLDFGEYLTDIEAHLKRLNRFLAEQVQQGVWAGVSLQAETAEPLELKGWRSIRHWHEGGPRGHEEQAIPLTLVHRGRTRTLRLAPYTALRRCRVCGQQDVFLYDSRAGWDLNDDFRLLDYLAGHGLALPHHRADDLATEAQHAALEPIKAVAAGEKVGEDYLDRATQELLEATSLKARYIEPTYLREPVRRFVEAREKGLIWLIAPGHTGKTLFVHGLAMPEHVGGKPLLERTAVVAFLIKREYQPWPEQLRTFLIDRLLKGALGIVSGRERLPELDTEAQDPAAVFKDLLWKIRQLMPAQRFDRFIVCLDGLDELPAMPQGKPGIAEFIPRSADLPEGCFLLLTSRPLTECPPHVARLLSERLPAEESEDFARLELRLGPGAEQEDVVTRGYLNLLRAYFDRELRGRQLAELHEALAAFVREHVQMVDGQWCLACRDDLGSALPLTLAKRVKQDWKELTRDIKVTAPATAPRVSEVVVKSLLARYEEVFGHALEKSGTRFVYLAHITELLRDHNLALGELMGLPTAGGLYQHYLRQLEQALAYAASPAGTASKLWDFARRLVLTLAAAERAHAEFLACLPPAYRDRPFRGVGLHTLAALLDEPPRSLRLVFTLYSLKEILVVWKGEETRDTQYALGLKDFAGTVAELWPEDLAACHRGLAEAVLDPMEKETDAHGKAKPLGLLGDYVLANAQLSGEAEVLRRVATNLVLGRYWDSGGAESYRASRYSAAIISLSLLTRVLPI